MTLRMRGTVAFPEYSGLRCYMMPVIRGRGESVPDEYAAYRGIINSLVLDGEDGQPGFITIDESFVEAGTSQRGYGSGERTLHTEACLAEGLMTWGPARPTWNAGSAVLLDQDLQVLVANSVDDTCMAWDAEVLDTTPDGDLSYRADEFPRSAGHMLKAGQVAQLGIFTPHECIPQKKAGPRQFFRIVGNGVHGRLDTFTDNPLVLIH